MVGTIIPKTSKTFVSALFTAFSTSAPMIYLLVFVTLRVSGNIAAIGPQRSQELPRQEGQRILDQYHSMMKNANTAFIKEGPTRSGRVSSESRLKRLGKMHSIYKGPVMGHKYVERHTYNDGKSITIVDVTNKFYVFADRLPDGIVLDGFEPLYQAKRPKFTESGKVREETFNGKPVYAIDTRVPQLTGDMETIFLDRRTLMPLGGKSIYRGKTTAYVYQAVKLNVPMDDSEFVWKPKAGYVLSEDYRARSR